MNTKLIKIEQPDMVQDMELLEAARILRDGGLVAFPTETVYGLGVNALDGQAAKKIYEAKGRPSDNPLIVHIGSFGELQDLVSEIPRMGKKLAEDYWPGPLTMVFPKSEKVPYGVTGGRAKRQYFRAAQSYNSTACLAGYERKNRDDY